MIKGAIDILTVKFYAYKNNLILKRAALFSRVTLKMQLKVRLTFLILESLIEC